MSIADNELAVSVVKSEKRERSKLFQYLDPSVSAAYQSTTAFSTRADMSPERSASSDRPVCLSLRPRSAIEVMELASLSIRALALDAQSLLIRKQTCY